MRISRCVTQPVTAIFRYVWIAAPTSSITCFGPFAGRFYKHVPTTVGGDGACFYGKGRWVFFKQLFARLCRKNILCCINSIEMHLADDRELIYTYTNTTHA